MQHYLQSKCMIMPLHFNIIMVKTAFSHLCPLHFYSCVPFICILRNLWHSQCLYSSLLPPFFLRSSLTSIHSKVSPALAIFGHWSIQSHGAESPAAKWQNEPFAVRIWWGGDRKHEEVENYLEKVDLCSEKQWCRFLLILQ